MEPSSQISEATQATLLLCSPLLASRQKAEGLLSPGEFNKLNRELEKNGAALPDLLRPDASLVLDKLSPELDRPQIEGLLGRGFLLSVSVEKWASLGLWVLSRNDALYPNRLTQRLGHLSPPLLYGCGQLELLNQGGIAIVGAREADQDATTFTEKLAARCAEEDLMVISGGAKGVDQTAMRSAAESGGRVVGVLAHDLARAVRSANARDLIRENRVVLISPFDPEAGFNVGNAMSRNKSIYALADFGVVVSSSLNEGGTWSGAIEQLEKFKQVPIYVRNGADVPAGNKELIRRGATPITEITSALRQLFSSPAVSASGQWKTGDLFESTAVGDSPSV